MTEPFRGHHPATATPVGTGRRLVHVITGLGAGGAEGMLGRLAPRLAALGWNQSVVSLQGRGPAADALDSASVEILPTPPVTSLSSVLALAEVVRVIRHSGADLIQGWMYHGNLAALLARTGVPVVWGIRQCVYNLSDEAAALRAVIRAGAIGSRWVDHTIYNSLVSRHQHAALGYRVERSTVIPNGFDVDRLAPDPSAREKGRQVLGIGPAQIAIGMVGRYHPVKGHDIFLRAFATVAEQVDAVAVLAGSRTDSGNQALTQQVSSLGLSSRVRLLGLRPDVELLLQAFDVLCCPSLSEAFPNVVGEAMTAGIPVVATDVGDVREILGEGGLVVPPGDSRVLAQALLDFGTRSAEYRRQSGLKGRRRIVSRFSLDSIALHYADAYASLLAAELHCAADATQPEYR